MFWWFERRGHYLRCEVRFLGDGRYEFVTTPPDGGEQVEPFSDAVDMTRRQQTVESELVADGWTGPHGWNI